MTGSYQAPKIEIHNQTKVPASPDNFDSALRERIMGHANPASSHLRPARDTFLGNLPLRANGAEDTAPLIGVKHHGNTQGYGNP